jgi:hypothetical protein
MNDEIIDERIRTRLQEIVSHDVPDAAAPRTSGNGRRRVVPAALVVAACLIVIAGSILLVRNDSDGQVVHSPVPATSTSAVPTASVTTAKGLANFPLEPRWNVALVAVPDGFIIWGGGREAQNMGLPPLVPDRAEYADGARYRASTDTWTKIPPAPVTVELRLVGGRPSFGAWVADTLYVARGKQAAAWDPTTGEWRRLPDLAANVEGLVAVNDEIIAIGPDTELAASAATTWTALPPRPAVGPHLGLDVVAGGDTVYVVPDQKVGGGNAPIAAFSTTSRTWHELPIPPIATGALDAGWDGSGLVVVNRATQNASTDHPSSARESARYDPDTNGWTGLDDLPVPLLPIGHVHLTGTADRFVASTSAGSAALVGKSWKFQPTPAHALASVASDGVIYTLTLRPIGDEPSPTHNVIVAS